MMRPAALAGLVMMVAIGCGTDRIQDPGPLPPPPPPVPPAGVILSEPVAPASASVLGGTKSHGLLAATETWVSLLPGTVAGGVVAEIRNRSQNVTRTAFLFAGGFDPVAITASAGDTLHLTVKDAGGSVLLSGMGLVPLARRPIVVRTNPPPRKRDVPLNATMIIVFSDPVNSATVTPTTLAVASGAAPVAGQITIAPDGTTAEFVPSAPLSPSTTYTVTVSAAVMSRGGSPVEPTSFEFTSAAGPEGIGMSQIAYVGCAESVPVRQCGIFVMNADGTNARQLTEASNDNYDSSPAWSPDGRWLAFSSHRHCALTGRIPLYLQGTCRRETYRMNADGSGIVQLTHREALDGVASEFPAWSPDGGWIAVSRSSSVIPTYGLARVRPDGSEFQVLVSSGVTAYGRPSWSPDGTRLVMSTAPCCTVSNGFDRGLTVMNADGTAPVQITTGGDGFPSWSPDGSRIAFQRQPQGGVGHIWVTSPDGTFQQPLTTGGTEFYLTPTWSPDGSRIALKTNGENLISQLWIMRADGSSLRLLHAGWANLPAWSPFGTVPPD